MGAIDRNTIETIITFLSTCEGVITCAGVLITVFTYSLINKIYQ